MEAVKVSEMYHRVMLIIQELNVASLNKQGLTEDREKETQLLVRLTEQEQESLSEEQEKIQRKVKELEKEVDKYGKQLDEAIKDIPSAGNLAMIHCLKFDLITFRNVFLSRRFDVGRFR